MELNNEFEVAIPVAEAWKVLTDVEKIAPCMPGAELREVEGDEYRGLVKVKVGPITASYRGTARFEELDAKAHKAVLKAEGRETRGQGNATALIKATLSPSTKGTKVEVVTDLAITGKVAQFGRGVLADVSGKLLDQFVHNLETTVLAAPAPASRRRRRWAADAAGAGRVRQPVDGNGSSPGASRSRGERRLPRRPLARSRAKGAGARGVRPPRRHEAEPESAAGEGERGTRRAASEAPAPRADTGPRQICVGARRAGRPDRRGGRIGDETPGAVSDRRGDPAHGEDRRLLDAAPPTVNEGDREAVAELLGRQPQGAFEIVVRDSARQPVVILNSPLLEDGTPMPTRYWLVGRSEREWVSRLESAGGVRAAEAAVDACRARGCTRRYEAHSRRLDSARVHAGRGPTAASGGRDRGVKCLHAHLAWYLAGGPDPVGRWTADKLGIDRREPRPHRVGSRVKARSSGVMDRSRRSTVAPTPPAFSWSTPMVGRSNG